MSVEEIFRDYVSAINAHSVRRLCGLMTEDHAFIDSVGEAHRGRSAIRQGWAAYFSIVPDYKIELLQVLVEGQTILAHGVASGTYARSGSLAPADFWTVPSAWRAVVEGQHIALWQVFADNEPIRARMRSDGKPPA